MSCVLEFQGVERVMERGRTPKISVRGVSKTFPGRCGPVPGGRGVTALDGIDLDVHDGEFFCLLGPSGCGKTTLLNILAGFERPSAGEVLIDGVPVSRPHPKRITIFQEYALLPWRSVLGNVEFGLEVAGVPQLERRRVALELIELVGLRGYEGRMPWELSGGMRQRVAVARALAVDPDVLFMDEPFGALDAMTRLRMEEELARIWVEKRKTIVFVTHDIDEAIYLADRVGVMTSQPGRIKRVVEIPLGRPRDRMSFDFVKIKVEIQAEFELIPRSTFVTAACAWGTGAV